MLSLCESKRSHNHSAVYIFTTNFHEVHTNCYKIASGMQTDIQAKLLLD